jgi:hypothetical protein
VLWFVKITYSFLIDNLVICKKKVYLGKIVYDSASGGGWYFSHTLMGL